jgi:hypothetical protein
MIEEAAAIEDHAPNTRPFGPFADQLAYLPCCVDVAAVSELPFQIVIE